MDYKGVLLVVKDIQKSKEFYQNLLGLSVIDDFGANVTLTGGIFLQTLDSWKSFIDNQPVTFYNHAQELYFEEDDFDGFVKKLAQFEVDFVHPVKEHAWGQKAVRFYDMDKHVIEVGEPITAVINRFLESGLSVKDTAKRMDVPVEYIENNK